MPCPSLRAGLRRSAAAIAIQMFPHLHPRRRQPANSGSARHALVSRKGNGDRNANKRAGLQANIPRCPQKAPLPRTCSVHCSVKGQRTRTYPAGHTPRSVRPPPQPANIAPQSGILPIGLHAAAAKAKSGGIGARPGRNHPAPPRFRHIPPALPIGKAKPGSPAGRAGLRWKEQSFTKPCGTLPRGRDAAAQRNNTAFLRGFSVRTATIKRADHIFHAPHCGKTVTHRHRSRFCINARTHRLLIAAKRKIAANRPG